MRINFDINQAVLEDSGIGIHESGLAVALSKMDDVEVHGCANRKLNPRHNDFSNLPFKTTNSIVLYNIAYSRKLPFSYEAMMRSVADVNLFGHYRLPECSFKKPVVASIYDLILLKSGADASMLDEHMAVLRDTVSRADGIVTISENSKADIVEVLGIDPDKVGVVYGAIDPDEFRCAYDARRVSLKYGLPERYMLYFGAYRQHKNIERIIRAYSGLPEDLRKDLKLVITCRNEGLLRLVGDLGVEDDVIFTGFVDAADKYALYSMAEISVYPSLYEGFGLPLLEAAVAGTPVITSNCSCIPEVVSDSALLVDPLSDEEMREAMLELAGSDSLRGEIVARAERNLERFTWDKSATAVSAFLRRFV